jgi:magnesium transporter
VTVAEVKRPIPLSRVWTRSKILAEDLSGEDLNDIIELHSDASAWWVLPRDDDYAAAELREVAKTLELDHLAVRDLMATDRRAKFESVGQARLVITNAVSLDRESVTLSVHPVSIIITNRALICMVAPTDAFQPGRLLLQKENLLADGGVEVALQLVMTAVINTYENALQFLEDSSDALADALFEERPLDKSEQLHAFRLRSALSQLRRLTDPMRAVMTDITDNPPPLVKGKPPKDHTLERRWKLITEQQTRVANAADALREALSSIFDTSLALADARLNQIMKKLTAWAAIIAVPTLVTSFVGMNVGFPLAGTLTGFWVYLLLMIVSGLVLYVVFRRRDWI